MNHRFSFLSFVTVMATLVCLPVFAESEKSLSISLQQGNLLSIIEPTRIRTEEADEAHKRYYDVAIDLAQQYGYKNHGVLRVTETLKGKNQPGIFALATWPNAEADATFESLPMWQEYKALRPVIWETLRFFKSSAQQDTQLVFKKDKIYTVAFSWFAEGYTQEQNEKALKKAGGERMFQMHNPRFDTHSAPYNGPDLVTITAWQTIDSYKTYNEMVNLQYAQQEIYRVAPIIR